MAAANSTSRSSCFPVCVVNLPTTWLPRRLPRFESKMSRHGLRKRSAKPCYRYAEESLAVVSLRSWKQKPPNSLLIQDKTFYNLDRPPGTIALELPLGCPVTCAGVGIKKWSCTSAIDTEALGSAPGDHGDHLAVLPQQCRVAAEPVVYLRIQRPV